ncbi:MAG TPA: M1 family aminopeptidase [Vicinamibacterales bacterium]|jgi:aminopeptidase N|nr:M1 family aminopeptidase [Vicinamibacterales bacterium]
MRWLAAAAAVVALQVPVTLDPDNGVSESLARDRAARISDVRYDLAFTIPAVKKDPVSTREVVRFALTDASAPLILDFAPNGAGILKKAEVNGTETPVRQVNGHLIAPAASLHTGENAVSLEFNAGDASLNRSDDFLYTIFVPARAHEAFPCFDQPDLKARWSLALDVPDGWQLVANGAELDRQTEGGRTRVRFAQTAPIPTYVFAFAAGRFNVEQGERNGRTFRMFHRETDAAKVARNREAIFDLHAAALKWLEDYTGIAYPFGKFDFFLVPAFQFGGMEHPGAIFYNANGLMLDESATQEQLLGRASVISHETSHMWFGDLVTMKWFNDVWMKEVFANFMAAKIVNPSFPAINHDLRFLLEYYPTAYSVDRTAGTNEIRQPLANLSDAGTLYGAIIYQKAPIVMRQLESLTGPDAFRDGLREYLKKYSYGNATWPDLIAILGRHTREDLAAFSHAWVEQRGRPIIRQDAKFSAGRIAHLSFTQQDPQPDRRLVWNQHILVAAGAETVKTIPVALSAAHVEVPAARGVPAKFVLPNGAGIAYGEIHLDPASLAWLTSNVSSIDDELTRGSAWVTLWDAVLDNEVKPDAFIETALKSLPLEKNELVTSRILSYTREDYWRYTSQEARLRLAPRLEAALRAGLAAAPVQTSKSVWFSAIRDVAQTKPTLDWLARVWRHEEQVPGLTLAETDEIRLVEELAVRGVEDAAKMLDEQYARTKNPDRKAQFAFVRPALSADPAERDKWFAALADVANRRREPWVLEGLRYLHHPLRESSSEKYIEPGLLMLREIQRSGDIFFPKRWMDATLGGHRSPAAAAIVRAFVDRLPAQYPLPLRRVILSSADELFRAAGLRSQLNSGQLPTPNSTTPNSKTPKSQ